MVKTVLLFLSLILLVSFFLNSALTGFQSYDIVNDLGIVNDISKIKYSDQQILKTKDYSVLVARFNKDLYLSGFPKNDVGEISLDVEGNVVVLFKEKNFKEHFKLASKSCIQEKDSKVVIPANPSTPFTGYATKWSESEKFNLVLKSCQDAIGSYGIEKLNGLEKANTCKRKLDKALECQNVLHKFNQELLSPEDLEKIPLLGHDDLGETSALECYCNEKLKYLDDKLSKETNLGEKTKSWQERYEVVNWCYINWFSGSFDECRAPILGRNEYGEKDASINYCKEKLSRLEELGLLISHEYDPKHKQELIDEKNNILQSCEEGVLNYPGEWPEELLNSLSEFEKETSCLSENIIGVNNPSNEIKISSGDEYVLIKSSSKEKNLVSTSSLTRTECPKKRNELTPKKKALEDKVIVPPKLIPFSCGDYAHTYINDQLVKSGEVLQGTKIKCVCDEGYRMEGNKCVPASPEQDCTLVGGSFDSSSGKCLLCPQGTTLKNGKCSCEQGYVLSGNQCVPACDPPRFFDQSGQCTSCQDFCQSKGMTTQQVDHTAYVQNYLNQNGVCKTRADIQGGGNIKVTGTNCQCFDPNPPQISISGDAICQQTPCGPVACNSAKSCSCGQGCTMTVTCNWGGWNYIPGRGAVPILQPGTSQQQSPQQDVQVPADYQGGYGGGGI